MSRGAKRSPLIRGIDRPGDRLSWAWMDEDEKRTDDRKPAKAGPAVKADREARLAAALRTNLRRRKAGAAKPERGGTS